MGRGCDGCALCLRVVMLASMLAGIVLSILTAASCEFITTGYFEDNKSSVGLFKYEKNNVCISYADDFPWTNSDQTARVCALLAPIIAAGAGLLGIIQCLFCNICCDRCFISCFFTAAQIAQALSFFFFNGVFCTMGFGCQLADGAYYSIGAWAAYFVAGVLLCFSPKPNPLCCQKEKYEEKDEEALPQGQASAPPNDEMKNEGGLTPAVTE